MKGKIIVSRFWTRFFSGGKASAVTIFPFIFLLRSQDRSDQVLINHERIHLVQALELLVLPFYLWYLTEFLIRFIQCRNFHQAYMYIGFEREAFAHEHDLDYLNWRSLWAFRKFL